MTNGLIYKGSVTVKTLHGDRVVKTKKIKNTGCAPLFSFIADAMLGKDLTNKKPEYINLFYTTVAEGNNPLLTQYIGTQTIVLSVIPVHYDIISSHTDSGETPSASIEYTFTVPANIIVDGLTANAGSKVNVIGLYNGTYSNNYSNPSAWIRLSDNEEIQGVSKATGISYVVIWKMTFSNKTEVESNE